MITIDLPWPPRALSPNSRVHWGTKGRAAKLYRQTAGWCAKEAGIRSSDFDIPQALKVTLVFAPPSKHHFDDDNLVAQMKAGLDGVADVIGIDDSKWQIALRREAPIKGGKVTIELEAAT